MMVLVLRLMLLLEMIINHDADDVVRIFFAGL